MYVLQSELNRRFSTVFMSDNLPSQDPSNPLEESELRPRLDLPDDLPPVEPPSAGMIIQLFVVPAIIVLIVIGVYSLFGQLASAELDWRQLTLDVKSENPNIRWRGALGLAHMLDADAQRGEKSQHLTSNSEIAQALSELFVERIKLTKPNEQELKDIEFLSKALGRMDVEEVIVPAFQKGISIDREHEIRKHSMIGLAMLAGQLHQQGQSLLTPGIVAEVIEISKEPETLFRHQAAYVLGLVSDQTAKDRLEVLLEDPDQMTRVNAAVSFARNNSTIGMEVFQELFQQAITTPLDPATVKTEEDESNYFEHRLMLKNALRAIDQLRPVLDQDQSNKLVDQLKEVIESTLDNEIRTNAKQLMLELQADE